MVFFSGRATSDKLSRFESAGYEFSTRHGPPHYPPVNFYFNLRHPPEQIGKTRFDFQL